MSLCCLNTWSTQTSCPLWGHVYRYLSHRDTVLMLLRTEESGEDNTGSNHLQYTSILFVTGMSSWSCDITRVTRQSQQRIADPPPPATPGHSFTIHHTPYLLLSSRPAILNIKFPAIFRGHRHRWSCDPFLCCCFLFFPPPKRHRTEKKEKIQGRKAKKGGRNPPQRFKKPRFLLLIHGTAWPRTTLSSISTKQ